MKKVLLISAMITFLVACGGEDKESVKQLEALADRVETVEKKILELEKAKGGIVSSAETGKNLFYCKDNREPISRQKYQDGVCDCSDGSDELPGTCK